MLELILIYSTISHQVWSGPSVTECLETISSFISAYVVLVVSFSLVLDYWIIGELVSLLSVFRWLTACQVLPSGSVLIVWLWLTAVNYTLSLLARCHPLQGFILVHLYSKHRSWLAPITPRWMRSGGKVLDSLQDVVSVSTDFQQNSFPCLRPSTINHVHF